MYWYLSFLRPPPVGVALSAEHVTITPQVANDLRTELRYEPTEIFYTWQRVHPVHSKPVSPLQHLTTFAPPSSTYRSFPVPLPKVARPGEQWRLGLFPTEASSDAAALLSFSGDDVGIVAVWSEGIEILRGESSGTGRVRGIGGAQVNGKGGPRKEILDGGAGKGKGKGKEKAKEKVEEGPKQGRITREWRLPGHGELLKVIEQTSFDLDKKIWDSGLALSSWLWRNLDTSTDADTGEDGWLRGIREILLGRGRAVDELASQHRTDILELGSGTGLVSIALDLALRALDRTGVRITATDLDSAIDLMQRNLQLNGLCPASGSNDDDVSSGSSIQARVLDWDAPLPDWVSHGGTWPDIIIAADVTYNTASFPALLQTLTSLLAPSCTEKRPLFLLAYKQRDIGERALWDMLRGKGIQMEKIEVVRGAEGEGEDGAVEIWVGQAA